jgi:hypothetical protein
MKQVIAANAAKAGEYRAGKTEAAWGLCRQRDAAVRRNANPSLVSSWCRSGWGVSRLALHMKTAGDPRRIAGRLHLHPPRAPVSGA